MNRYQQSRQVLLDLLSEYQQLDTPAHPDLLKIHIDNATDRLEAIYQVSDLAGTDPKAKTGLSNPQLLTLLLEARPSQQELSKYTLNMFCGHNPPSNTTKTNIARHAYNQGLDDYERNIREVLK